MAAKNKKRVVTTRFLFFVFSSNNSPNNGGTEGPHLEDRQEPFVREDHRPSHLQALRGIFKVDDLCRDESACDDGLRRRSEQLLRNDCRDSLEAPRRERLGGRTHDRRSPEDVDRLSQRRPSDLRLLLSGRCGDCAAAEEKAQGCCRCLRAHSCARGCPIIEREES